MHRARKSPERREEAGAGRADRVVAADPVAQAHPAEPLDPGDLEVAVRRARVVVAEVVIPRP